MKPSIALSANRDAIREIVRAHHADNARVFGSVLHAQDTEDSDLDILVEPQEDMTLMDVGAIQMKLSDLLGVPVDVLTPGALPESFRQQVMSEAVLI
jgi:uncharacterized protein